MSCAHTRLDTLVNLVLITAAFGAVAFIVFAMAPPQARTQVPIQAVPTPAALVRVPAPAVVVPPVRAVSVPAPEEEPVPKPEPPLPKPGETVLIRGVGGRSFVGIDLLYYGAFWDSIAAKDIDGVFKMVEAKQVLELTEETRCLVLKVYPPGFPGEHHYVARVRIQGGPHEGDAVYLPAALLERETGSATP
jgi:hypothetical protein